jgi:hypothetical protein
LLKRCMRGIWARDSANRGAAGEIPRLAIFYFNNLSAQIRKLESREGALDFLAELDNANSIQRACHIVSPIER